MVGIRILYEDQRDDQARPFGLHSLILACVADDLGCEVWKLKHVKDDLKKGRDKVRAECERNLARLTRDGSHVIAVYDLDEAHQACKGPLQATCKPALKRALTEGCNPAEKLAVILLDQNVETVLGVVRRLRPDLVGADRFEMALRHKKSRASRDLVLNTAAQDGALRGALLREVPSLAYAVQVVVRILREQDSPAQTAAPAPGPPRP
jgi:hypothetical protein